MGQQELIILILTFVIVGIATVAAINTFQSSRDTANYEAVKQDMLNYIGKAQKYYFMPQQMGGGGESFDGINKQLAGIDTTNTNAEYTLTESDQTLVIEGTNTLHNVRVRATVTMTSSQTPSILWEDF